VAAAAGRLTLDLAIVGALLRVAPFALLPTALVTLLS
jgi:hypothetical protein